MAKAKVSLMDTGPVSFEGKGYKLDRGQVLTIINEADILYFQSQAGISVELISDEKPKAPSGPKAKASLKAAPKADESDEAEGDDEEDTGDPEDDGPADGAITAAELNKMTKAALLQYNEEEKVGAKVDASMSKNDIIAALLEAMGGDDES